MEKVTLRNQNMSKLYGSIIPKVYVYNSSRFCFQPSWTVEKINWWMFLQKTHEENIAHDGYERRTEHAVLWLQLLLQVLQLYCVYCIALLRNRILISCSLKKQQASSGSQIEMESEVWILGCMSSHLHFSPLFRKFPILESYQIINCLGYLCILHPQYSKCPKHHLVLHSR